MKIFLAEDHNFVRQGIRGLLEALGHEVVGEAENIDELKDKLPHSKPELLLTDYSMPGGDIIDTIADFKQKTPKLKIIVMTGLDQISVYKRVLSSPTKIDGLLLKTTDTQEFNAALEAIQYNKQYVQFSIRQRLAESDHSLTDRQLQILEEIAEGQTNREIAEKLHIAIKTVDAHRTQIMKKLGVNNTVRLITAAKERGIL